MKLIDADILKENIEKYRIVHLSHRRLSAIRRESEEVINDICFAIDAAQTIDPVKHGHWIEIDDELITGTCSVCGWDAIFAETDVVGMSYCPNCGAKMDEVDDDT